MRYFYEPVEEYITRGVAEHVHGYLLLKCIQMLTCMKEKKIEPDYLQVYRLSYDEQEKRLSIQHSQEEPDYENTVSFEYEVCEVGSPLALDNESSSYYSYKNSGRILFLVIK